MKSPPGACLHVALGLLALLALLFVFASPAHADKKRRVRPAPTSAPQSTAEPEPAAEPSPRDKRVVASTATTANPGKKEQTYTFGGLDIDGKLKTPQLLYFLNRMKSEFDTTTPDRRSFIPELKRSTEEM